jgi:tryptophanyl-tRNA synthetase
MSLKDGTKKMSKSELSDLSRINLTDEKDQIINKIKKAKQIHCQCHQLLKN